MHVCECVKRKARGTVGVWAAEREETKEAEKRDEEQRVASVELIGWVGGGDGGVLGVAKGSSLKALLRYSQIFLQQARLSFGSESHTHTHTMLTSYWDNLIFM